MRTAALAAGFAVFAAASCGAAQAADCPGNPDAIGVSRTIVVDPREHLRVGSFQYPETLPLADKEIVLTLDDAPRPGTARVLDILAAECVKATYFIIGRHAREFPDLLRRIRDEGHTIGTHSQNHKLTFNRMGLDRAEREIDDGIQSVKDVLGEGAEIAPFFRIPGLLRSDAVERAIADRGLMLWSTDVMAHDWKRRITPDGIVQRAIDRIEEKGKGILLLHDIHPKTADALPTIFRMLKERGYRIVHVAVQSAAQPKTPSEPQEWVFRPPGKFGWPPVAARVPGPLPGDEFTSVEGFRPRAANTLRVATFDTAPDWPHVGSVGENADAILSAPDPKCLGIDIAWSAVTARRVAAAMPAEPAAPRTPRRRGARMAAAGLHSR